MYRTHDQLIHRPKLNTRNYIYVLPSLLACKSCHIILIFMLDKLRGQVGVMDYTSILVWSLLALELTES